jgi:guanylate kinase
VSSPRPYVLSAPSGGGKTSLIRALLERDPSVTLSVSYTTRAPRPGEQDSVHYHFVDEAAFQALAERGEFLEHAHVFGHRYGTGREAVQRQLAAGYDVLLDIDWQGARQVRETFPAVRTIFILPPSLAVLRQRLIERGQDSEATIARRMEAARAEISHAAEFDELVINNDFEEALTSIHSIVRRCDPDRKQKNRENREFLAELLETG